MQLEDIKLEGAFTIIKSWEGIEDGDPTTVNLDPYLCPAGVWSIGWGHAILDKNGKMIRGKENKALAYSMYPNGITMEEAEEILYKDVKARAWILSKFIKLPVNNNQFNALLSLMFNIGEASFKTSTVLSYLNLGNFKEVPDRMRLWNKIRVDGELIISKGLVNRRESEVKLFTEPTDER